MTLFRQLYDPQTSAHYMIDAKALIVKVESDDIRREARLTPFHAAILIGLFSAHPNPLSYTELQKVLTQHRLSCPDDTRLHRKVSELRAFLHTFCEGLTGAIQNARGVGYRLPLHWKDPNALNSGQMQRIKSTPVQTILRNFEGYVADSVRLTEKCRIQQTEEGYVLQRKRVTADIEKMVAAFESQKQRLFQELQLHPADFWQARLELLLAKLKTYLSLARISTYSITREQWLEWHAHETRQLLDDLTSLIQRVEAVAT